MSSIEQMFGGAPGGPPLVGGPEPEPQQQGGGNMEAIENAIRGIQDAIKAYLEIETDEEDRVVAETMATDAQKLLANNQKMVDQITGAGTGAKVMRKVGQ